MNDQAKPAKPVIYLRVSEQLHERVTRAADVEGKSVTAYCIDLLKRQTSDIDDQ